MNTDTTFRQKFSLFQNLPDEVYFSLDLSHFYLPNKRIEQLKDKLENLLDHYVITYYADIFRLDIPLQTHLCAILAGANLTKPQQLLLKKFEEMLKPANVTLVIFQKPLTFLSPEQTAIYQKYRELNLL